jgi:hypothetical protein
MSHFFPEAVVKQIGAVVWLYCQCADCKDADHPYRVEMELVKRGDRIAVSDLGRHSIVHDATGLHEAFFGHKVLPSGGVKGKKLARFDLLPPEPLWEVAEVMGYAAEHKYAPRNWEAGLDSGDLIAAALRHIHEYMGGKEIDEDSGKSPIAHAICVLMFLRALEVRGRLTDDRSTSVDLGSLRSETLNSDELLDVT